MTDVSFHEDGYSPCSPFRLAGIRARQEAQAIKAAADAMRLASFRRYLAAAVNSMSSPVADVLALIDVDVEGALRRLRPCRTWPSRAGFDMEHTNRSKPRQSVTKRSGARFRRSRIDMYAFPYRVGDAILNDGALSQWVEVAVECAHLDVTLRSGSFELSTVAGKARVSMAMTLPDVMISACLGRRLNEVITHELFVGRDYIINAVDSVDGELTVEFETGSVPIPSIWMP